MNDKASTAFACGIVALTATLAQFNGHIEPVAFYQVLGSVIAVPILSNMLAGFK